MKYRPEDIFTPQGILEEVEHRPNLDFLLNIFNIPRAFGVSGFGGNWNVGMHSVAAAFIALFWAKFRKYPPDRTYTLVTHALLHDLHEAVTGDILPMFKSRSVKTRLESIQANILHSLGVEEDDALTVDLKIIDLVAFYYEIKQVSPNILHSRKLKLAHVMAEKQLGIIRLYCKKHGIKKNLIDKFLKELDVI